jgi:hypothetical protein
LLPDFTLYNETQCWFQEYDDGLIWNVDFDWVKDDKVYFAIRDNIDYYAGSFDESFLQAFPGYLMPSQVDKLFQEDPDHWLFHQDDPVSRYYAYEFENKNYSRVKTEFLANFDEL